MSDTTFAPEGVEVMSNAQPVATPLGVERIRPSAHEVHPQRARVREALDRVVASEDFGASRRSREFLRFVVEEALARRAAAVTQTMIATHVFGRLEDFDPLVDPIVRIQAGRLRRSLERYYLLSGAGDALRIELPRGTYVPVFRSIEAGELASADRGTTPRRG